MWTLENDGDLLEGKRLWLRPGRRYLFGRSKKRENGLRLIEDKSISRHHLAIEVQSVQNTDPGVKSALTVEELGSKYGTSLDGKSIKGSTEAHLLQGDEHILLLGHDTPVFRVKWHPVVLTFSASSGGSLPDLTSLDIHSNAGYDSAHTSHVVAGKRNTTKGLQALIDGRYIVGPDFVTALQEATAEEDEYSPLEKDFDAAWPREIDFLPAPGKEPGDWPSEKFMPDPRRKSVFESLSFLFFHKAQFESLQDVIRLGGGHSILLELTPGRSSAADAAQSARSNRGGGQVVVVQHNGDTSSEGWYRDTVLQIAILLDKKIIEQNEFLEAILVNNKKVYEKPLGKPKVNSSNSITASENERQIEAKTEGKKRSAKSRQVVTSRFKGFDDSFNQDESQDVDDTPALETESRSRRPRESTDNEALSLDNILPGIAAKRRRIGDVEPKKVQAVPAVKQESRITRGRKQESEVIKAAKEHTQAVDEAARREEAVTEAFTGEDADALRDIVAVETFGVKKSQSQASSSGEGKWAGRKNFKAFKKKGSAKAQSEVVISQHEPERQRPKVAPVSSKATTQSPEPEVVSAQPARTALAKVDSASMRPKGKYQTKLTMPEPEDDDSDSDELRFKFKKKAR